MVRNIVIFAPDIEPIIKQLQNGELPGDRISGISHQVFKLRVKNSDVTQGKSGGYNLEATRVTGNRLLALVLLICLSYSFSTFSGQTIKDKGVANIKSLSICYILISVSPCPRVSPSIICSKFKGKRYKYVTRPTEIGRIYQRHSSFSISLHSQNWLESITFFQDVIQELLCLSPHKLPYYLKGMRAGSIIQSAF